MSDLRTPPRPPRPPAGGDAPARPRMDPRIRERRVAVERDAGRRRLRLLLTGAAVLATVGAGYGTTRSPLLDVDRVEVEGAVSTPLDAVRAAAGLDGKRQLADLEPLAMEAAIERLPWVQEADVVRHWPGTVEVRLVERAPLAAVPAGAGGWAVVDRTGRVLEVQAEVPSGLAVVGAPPAPAPGARVGASARAGLAVVDELPATLSQLLHRVNVAEDDTLTLELRGLPVVRFGPAEQVRPKLVALNTLVDRADLRGVQTIDVRVPTAPVLTRT